MPGKGLLRQPFFCFFTVSGLERVDESEKIVHTKRAVKK